ncbi:hypothetical protein [Halorussus ruber]|uniref:hypothetical protein n=1 Tax=Halorussus ruber TaxID=1126238 RepID=UPI00109227BC|nr:hypothetical protein [Halorussus ruber]
MDEQTEQSSSSFDRKSPLEESSDTHPSRQTLLEESRTTADRQLAQITKLDDAAVRTVRIAFVLLGVVAGSARLPPFQNLGILGAVGTWALVGTLVAGLFVYGTSRLFLGSAPDELTVDYSDNPTVKQTHVELIGRYESGIQFNRSILHANGFTLLVARLLLALAVVFLVVGVFRYVVLSEEALTLTRTFIS